MSELFDPGLQPERTALAWWRTGLALLAGSMIAVRILSETLGAWAAILGLVGVIAAALLLYGIHRRYRRQHHRLTTEGDRAEIAGGRLIAATALFVFAAAVVSVAVTIVVAIRTIAP